MKLLIWGTETCADCVEVLEYLKKTHVQYKFIELNENIINLKRFLRLRDKEAIFDKVKEEGNVGVPAFKMEDGSLTLDWDYVKEEIEKWNQKQ